MFVKYTFFCLALATAALGAVASPESTNELAACKPDKQPCIFNKECCSGYCSWRNGSKCWPNGKKDPVEEALKEAAEAIAQGASD